MADLLPQNDPSISRRARDASNANLSLSFAGSVAAQSAGDSTADFADLQSPFLEMQPDSHPSSFPSARTYPKFPTPFAGDQSFASPVPLILRGGRPGHQPWTIDPRQYSESRSEPRRTVYRPQDLPWTPLEATGVPTGPATGKNSAASTHRSFVTPVRNLDTRSNASGKTSFHDSALGSSQHDARSVMSTQLFGMDSYSQSSGLVPTQQESSYMYDGSCAADADNDVSPQGDQADQQDSTVLKCDECQTTAKTPSDLKKHKARHNRKYVCDIAGCSRKSKGFATINDLHRHEKSVHDKHSRITRSYKCPALNCAKSQKVWPRLDNFKQHLQRMHPTELIDDLVARSDMLYASSRPSTTPSQSPGLRRSMQPQPQTPADSTSSRSTFNFNTSPYSQSESRSSVSGPIPAAIRTHALSPAPADPNRLAPPYRTPVSVGRPRVQGYRNTSNVQNQGRSQNLRERPNRGFVGQMPTSTPQTMTRTHSDTAARHVSLQGLGDNTDQSAQPFHGDITNNMNASEDVGPMLGQNFNFDSFFDDPFQPNQRVPWTAPVTDHDFHVQQVQLLHQNRPTDFQQYELPNSADLVMNSVGATMDYSMDHSPSTSVAPHTPGKQAPPTIVVGGEAESGQANDGPPVTIEGISLFLKEYEGKNEQDREPIPTEFIGRIRMMLESMHTNTNGRTSVSEGGLLTRDAENSSVKSVTCPANRKTYLICPMPGCGKTKQRRSDLKKHMKRHTRPYSCSFDGCYKHFGSKNDWKRHEKTQHRQSECFRCNGLHNSDGVPCYKVFFKGRDNYREHLEKAGVTLQIEAQINERWIRGNNQGHFWCGFCNNIIPSGTYGPEALNLRLNHIDKHFSAENLKIANWIELGGQGRTKGAREEDQKFPTDYGDTLQSADAGNDGDGSQDSQVSSSSSSSSTDNQPDINPEVQGRRHSQVSTTQQHADPQMRQRQSSNASQQQHLQQQVLREVAQHQQNAIRSQRRRHQQPQLFQDPPRQTKQAMRATCCHCSWDYPFALSKRCVSCEHPFCSSCEAR